jgi:hypothetical protein
MLRTLPILILVAVAFLSGCASVSVDRVHRPEEKVSAPSVIYVQEFSAPRNVFRVDRGKRDARKFRQDMAAQLARATALRATKRLVPAKPLERTAAIPSGHAWLVTGRFVRVNQGSRALRTVLGFGLGGTKLETEVVVYEIDGRSRREILRFRTTGGSNAGPGVAPGLIVPNLWLISLDVLVKIGPGLSHDVIRTSREIVAVLSEYMAREGFISPKKVYRAKKLGRWP